ncbi:MAG: uroporphyrinogen-III C-methyltransferase [Bacteroidetes bacterium]|nr:MAG: uroporphyrinogen-III C-methyltransferase [Bacteroidota bacterium]
MTSYKTPKITLVGAGPGDPELLTLKGLKALQTADVVLYDALVNPALLDHAPDDALKVFVGKRKHDHRFRQEEINTLLVEFANAYGHVVRLKGGDPFVFGRGHEEIAHARAWDIETDIVPGISSCISLPELQEVPVTRRGLNESFWVLTGTTRTGQLSDDIAVAARSSATAIILMGMSKLKEIAAIFSLHGKGDTPVLVIQNGSLPNERKVLGTVDTIAEKVTAAGLGHPGLIVIGEVVRLHPSFNFTEAARARQPALAQIPSHA